MTESKPRFPSFSLHTLTAEVDSLDRSLVPFLPQISIDVYFPTLFHTLKSTISIRSQRQSSSVHLLLCRTAIMSLILLVQNGAIPRQLQGDGGAFRGRAGRGEEGGGLGWLTATEARTEELSNACILVNPLVVSSIQGTSIFSTIAKTQ
ncbi:hypothetical protein BT96DRAFT_923335 [Gymnopus androsaceus JB14]|uniref:Uncharacterized protein n=1 Tax=Gymnopus androsaceus JB14 TaxID=1447944 RepID=A0A6A4H908_9AGAR|nr:hypothetical protein BT96DRAFT_923335 [Gymnopus androsaceus JB14]